MTSNGVTKQYRTFADVIKVRTWRRPGGVMDAVSAVLVDGVSVYPDRGGYYDHNVVETTFYYDEPYYDKFYEIEPYDIDNETRIRNGTYIGEKMVWTVNMGPILAIATSFGSYGLSSMVVGRVYFSFGDFHHSLMRYTTAQDSTHLGEFFATNTDNLVIYDHYFIMDNGAEIHSGNLSSGFSVWGYACNGMLFHTSGVVPVVSGSFNPNTYFYDSQHLRPYITNWSSDSPTFYVNTFDDNAFSQDAIEYVCGVNSEEEGE